MYIYIIYKVIIKMVRTMPSFSCEVEETDLRGKAWRGLLQILAQADQGNWFPKPSLPTHPLESLLYSQVCAHPSLKSVGLKYIEFGGSVLPLN